MANTFPQSKFDAAALQQAAAFDPSIVDKMRRWQEFYQPGGHENNLIDRLIVEAGGGPQARLPEQTMFGAAQGDVQAFNAVQHDVGLRDQLIGELIGGLDPAKFERFRSQQRATGALEGQLLNGPVAGALGARRQLIDALNTHQ